MTNKETSRKANSEIDGKTSITKKQEGRRAGRKDDKQEDAHENKKDDKQEDK